MPRARKFEPPIAPITPDVSPTHARFLETLNDKLMRLQRQLSDMRGLNGPVRLADNLDMTGHTIIGGGMGTAEGPNFLTQAEGDIRYLRNNRRQPDERSIGEGLRDWDAQINDWNPTPGTPLVVGTDKTVHKIVDVREGFRLQLDGWFATLKVAPDPGGTVEVDTPFSDDDGATFASIFSTLPAFAAGQTTAYGTAFARSTFPRLGKFRYDLATVDGVAADLGFWLIGREVPA